jgi:hypothetical protein
METTLPVFRGWTVDARREELRKVRSDGRHKVEAIIIVTPAPLRHFQLGPTPVYTINIADSSLMIEGLS